MSTARDHRTHAWPDPSQDLIFLVIPWRVLPRLYTAPCTEQASVQPWKREALRSRECHGNYLEMKLRWGSKKCCDVASLFLFVYPPQRRHGPQGICSEGGVSDAPRQDDVLLPRYSPWLAGMNEHCWKSLRHRAIASLCIISRARSSFLSECISSL